MKDHCNIAMLTDQPLDIHWSTARPSTGIVNLLFRHFRLKSSNDRIIWSVAPNDVSFLPLQPWSNAFQSRHIMLQIPMLVGTIVIFQYLLPSPLLLLVYLYKPTHPPHFTIIHHQLTLLFLSLTFFHLVGAYSLCFLTKHRTWLITNISTNDIERLLNPSLIFYASMQQPQTIYKYSNPLNII